MRVPEPTGGKAQHIKIYKHMFLRNYRDARSHKRDNAGRWDAEYIEPATNIFQSSANTHYVALHCVHYLHVIIIIINRTGLTAANEA